MKTRNKSAKMQVHAASEVNITDEIETEVQKAIQATIDTLSKKYYRTISADVSINVE